MTSEPIVSALSEQAKRRAPRRDLPFSIALAVPLLLLAACGGGQTAFGTGGAAGSTTGGTGGVGGKGSGGSGAIGGKGGGGSGAIGPGGNSGAGGKGGKGEETGGSSSGGGAGGAGGAGGGSSCAMATSGATCTSEGTTCGGPCTDICQFCNLLRCTGGHWQAMEAFPAPCFACGDGKCQTMTQYCRTTEGGPVGNTPTHACLAIPTECQSTRTCACLAQNNVPGICTMGSTGELMTLLEVP